MLRSALLGLTTALILQTSVGALADGPIVVPEQIQKLAYEFPIAERLGIKWEETTPDAIGRYMGILAAVNEVANVIAAKNERIGGPTDEDIKAALAAFCFWPNKPPVAEPYWPEVYAAFGSERVRQELRAAVGPLAIALPAAIAAGDAQKTVDAQWPVEADPYFNQVLDFKSLSGAR